MTENQALRVIHIQPMTGTVHSTSNCSVARRTRYGTTEVQLSEEVVRAFVAGIYRWCKRCAAGEPTPAPPPAPLPADAAGPRAIEHQPYDPGTSYFEIYSASPAADGYSTKNYPACISQSMAEHNARRYSRDGRAYVVEHVAVDGKRSKVSEFRGGRKVRS
jgi:hypothetical protein